jgi:hypothetical protein
MPLMYLPLIMYMSWMQSMLEPFGAMHAHPPGHRAPGHRKP